MKISIIVHSVSGNTYLLAKCFYEFLKSNNMDVGIFRVEDMDLEELSNNYPIIKEYYNEITSLKIATPEIMLNSDHIIFGCPTYFGNVSSEMKSYMDSGAIYWNDAKLAGKTMSSFTTASTSEGGGDLCLQAINTFGQHMGIASLPVPSNISNEISMPAYGFIHYTGGNSDIRPNENVYRAIERYCSIYLLK